MADDKKISELPSGTDLVSTVFVGVQNGVNKKFDSALLAEEVGSELFPILQDYVDQAEAAAADAAADAVLTAADVVTTDGNVSLTAADVIAAEAARDSTFISSTTYADEATGRAAVADGVQFDWISTDLLTINRSLRVSAGVSTFVTSIATGYSVSLETIKNSSIELAREVCHYMGDVDGPMAKAIYEQIYYMKTTTGRASTGTTIWDCLRRFMVMNVSKAGSFINWKDPTGKYMWIVDTPTNSVAYHPTRGWHTAESAAGTSYLEMANPADLSGVGQDDYCWGCVLFSGEFSSSSVIMTAGALDDVSTVNLSFQPLLNTSPSTFGVKMNASSVNTSNTIAGESAKGYTGATRLASATYTTTRNGASETETRTSTALPDGTMKWLSQGEAGLSLFFDGIGMDASVMQDDMNSVVTALCGGF